jgi:hypothetical protein
MVYLKVNDTNHNVKNLVIIFLVMLMHKYSVLVHLLESSLNESPASYPRTIRSPLIGEFCGRHWRKKKLYYILADMVGGD